MLLIAAAALTALDGYQGTPTDQRDYERSSSQLKGQFLKASRAWASPRRMTN
jgi:hypothetical protein